MTVCLHNVSTNVDDLLTFVAYRIDWFTPIFALKPNTLTYLSPSNQLNQSALTTSWTPKPTPPNTRSALSNETCTDSDVCSQRKHWLSPSPCSLPLPPPAGGKLSRRKQTNSIVFSLFLFSSWSHQPGVEGEVYPSWRSVSGSGCLPLPGSALETGLPQRLAHPLLLLGLPQRCLPAFCSICPRHTDSLRIIQGESWRHYFNTMISTF